MDHIDCFFELCSSVSKKPKDITHTCTIFLNLFLVEENKLELFDAQIPCYLYDVVN